MNNNPVIKAIADRRSVRAYTDVPVEREQIEAILEAGVWAPSGNNLQPWRFVVVTNEELVDKLATLTVYRSWVKTAPCLILVYYDTSKEDDKVFLLERKHQQAMGACIQNMLLASHSLGLGTCWIGEILKQQDKVNQITGVGRPVELTAMITLGYSAKASKSKRVSASDMLLGWFE